MLNTMVVVKMEKTNYTEWKKIFDGDAEKRAKFMRDAMVGKVDENTAVVTADVFDPEGMKQALSDPELRVNVWKKWALNTQYTCCNLLQYPVHRR